MPKLDTYVKGIITSSETSRRLACDASVVHWLDTQKGELLSIGRKSRTIPPAIRRALQRRDGRCRFPGCTCSRFVDAHHVHHWADGGEFTFAMPDGRALSNNRHGRFRGHAYPVVFGRHKM